MTAAVPTPELAPGQPGRVLATVTAAQVLNVAAATVVAVALPSLSRDLNAAGTEQQWVVDAFVLVFASLLIAGGVLADRYGRRRALLAGLAIFAIGSLWCALAPSVGWLIAGRVVMALGPPLVLPASLAIVGDVYRDPVEQAHAIGLWGGGSGLGVVLGPLVGGLVVEGLGWRWVFGINVPLALLLAALAWRFVPRDTPERARTRFDLPAAVMLTSAVALVVFALIEGRGLGWTSATVLGAFAAATAIGVAFVHRERRHRDPLVDIALLRNRTFAAANLGGATLYGALTGLAIYLSVYLQQIQGRSALEAGLCLLPQGVLIALAAPLAGRLAGRFGVRPPMLAGMAMSCVAIVWLVTVEPGSHVAELALPFALLGLGTGIAMPAMTVTALASAPEGKAGMASAIHNASRQLGQTFAVAVLGTIILSRAPDLTDETALSAAAATEWTDALHVALLTAAAGLAIATVAVGALARTRAPAR